jgi:hypothetical protein
MKKQINLALLESLFDLDWPITVTKAYDKGETLFPFQRSLILHYEDELVGFYGIVALLAKTDGVEISQVKPREAGVNVRYVLMRDLIQFFPEDHESYEHICLNCLHAIVMGKPPDEMDKMEFHSFQVTIIKWHNKGYVPVGMHSKKARQFFKAECCPLCGAKPGERVNYIFKQINLRP